MFDRQKIAADFSRSAVQYAEHSQLQKRIGLALIDTAMGYIKNTARLLDVGAGSGEVTMLWPCASKVALDIADGMCEQARLKRLEAVCAPAEELPFADSTYDVVASNVMLQWLENPSIFFTEAARVITPKGYLCVTYFSHGTLGELDAAFKVAIGTSSVSPFLSHDDMKKHLERVGFDVLAAQEKIYHEPYKNIMELFAYLRAIGANNKLQNRKRGLLTPRQLNAIKNAYPTTPDGIRASWQVGFIIASKSA